jgi:hypothetical protein
MSSSLIEKQSVLATSVKVTNATLTVELSDGRIISVPTAWYPRLAQGTTAERDEWRLIGNGNGIHWPKLDEDISISNLLLGQASGESQSSLKSWLLSRARTKPIARSGKRR